MPPSDLELSFMHTRRPHTFQLYFATTAAVIYACAVPGLIAVHNPIAAAGWGAACVLCICWVMLLRRENQWRRIEQLPVQTTTDEFCGVSSSPLTQSLVSRSDSLSTGRMPWFIGTGALWCTYLIGVGLLATSIFFFIISGRDHERLNGTSHWLPAIAFLGAMKSAIQLAVRMKRMRLTYYSVSTYIKESEATTP